MVDLLDAFNVRVLVSLVLVRDADDYLDPDVAYGVHLGFATVGKHISQF